MHCAGIINKLKAHLYYKRTHWSCDVPTRSRLDNASFLYGCSITYRGMYVTTSYRKTNPLMTLIAIDINKSLMLPAKWQNWRTELVRLIISSNLSTSTQQICRTTYAKLQKNQVKSQKEYKLAHSTELDTQHWVLYASALGLVGCCDSITSTLGKHIGTNFFDLGSSDPKRQSVHLCPKMHYWQKLSENT